MTRVLDLIRCQLERNNTKFFVRVKDMEEADWELFEQKSSLLKVSSYPNQYARIAAILPPSQEKKEAMKKLPISTAKNVATLAIKKSHIKKSTYLHSIIETFGYISTTATSKANTSNPPRNAYPAT